MLLKQVVKLLRLRSLLLLCVGGLLLNEVLLENLLDLYRSLPRRDTHLRLGGKVWGLRCVDRGVSVQVAVVCHIDGVFGAVP